MQKIENYKGCSLDARSNQLNAGGYDAEVFIAQLRGGETLVTPFFLKKTFDTPESALEAALQTGRHKVDVGFEPKFTTADAEPE